MSFSAEDDALRARVEAVSRDLEASAADTAAVVREIDAVHDACATATGDARDHIRELSRQVAERRRASGSGHVEDEYAALAAELSELEVERDELRAAAGAPPALAADAGGDDDPELARARHAVSLFTNITRITWAPDCGDGVIAGVVAYDGGHRARRFSVDAAGKDDFAVAAELWALLEEGGAGAY